MSSMVRFCYLMMSLLSCVKLLFKINLYYNITFLDLTHHSVINLVLLFQDYTISTTTAKSHNELSIFFLLQCYEYRLSATLHRIDQALPWKLTLAHRATSATITTTITPSNATTFETVNTSSFDLSKQMRQIIHILLSKRIKLVALDHAVAFFAFIYHMILIHSHVWRIEDLEQIIDDCALYQHDIMRCKEVLGSR